MGFRTAFRSVSSSSSSAAANCITGNFTNAAAAEVRDAQGQVVLQGHVRLNVGGNARALIADRDDIPVTRLLEPGAHRAAPRGVPDGVVQQVDDQAPDEIFVAGEHGRGAR